MSAGKDFAQGHKERERKAGKARPTLPGDPANVLKHDDYRSRTDLTLEDPNCYICNDPEYAQMGLPLCYPCSQCKGHVPADDTICTGCEHDQVDDHCPTEQREDQA